MPLVGALSSTAWIGVAVVIAATQAVTWLLWRWATNRHAPRLQRERERQLAARRLLESSAAVALTTLPCPADDADPEAAAGELADAALGLAGSLMETNERLRAKLTLAEVQAQEQARQIAAHRESALTDALTRLRNRRAFDRDLAAELEQQSAESRSWLLLVDADHFKQVNDQHGHVAGDEVLRQLARALSHQVGPRGRVYRYGGEEFAILLRGQSEEQVETLAQALRREISRRALLIGESWLRITVSIGLSPLGSGDDKARLIQRADDALYAAKAAGRNCCFVSRDHLCCPARELEAAEPAPVTGLAELYDQVRNRLQEALAAPGLNAGDRG